jgi:hypothetical protein
MDRDNKSLLRDGVSLFAGLKRGLQRRQPAWEDTPEWPKFRS